ncbi:hypothetical protein [Caballeronia sordidicola]|uniref:hypothetical protein n=1 Tax=Caballeronia sordidicola TaxID=196367 RepID=UPI00118010B7|nr:hypothetical protein [Caballeronia sordidicola]
MGPRQVQSGRLNSPGALVALAVKIALSAVPARVAGVQQDPMVTAWLVPLVQSVWASIPGALAVLATMGQVGPEARAARPLR